MSIKEDNIVDIQNRFDRERLKRQIGAGQPVLAEAARVKVRDIDRKSVV